MAEASEIAKRIAWVAVALWVLLLGYFVATFEGFVPKTPRQFIVVVFLIGPLLIFAEPLLSLVFYGVGRVLLPLVTFGRARSEAPSETLSFPWHGLARSPNGSLVVSAEAVAVFGAMCAALITVIAFAFIA
jgi:hypothetical protein